MSDRVDELTPELRSVAERLRAERPTLDGLELDSVKTRARARAAAAEPRARRHGKGALLKSRLAITMMLALGILMSLSGAGMAVSGLDVEGNTADVEYPREHSTSTLVEPGDRGGGGVGHSSVEPAGQEGTDGGGGGELAFTGFVAIPVLIGGLALLASGLVLRRRAAREG